MDTGLGSRLIFFSAPAPRFFLKLLQLLIFFQEAPRGQKLFVKFGEIFFQPQITNVKLKFGEIFFQPQITNVKLQGI